MDPIRNWLMGISYERPYSAGGFLQDLAIAALHADEENYQILRPALEQLQKKYPIYSYSNSKEEA
jgi:hypothetical protein